MAEGNSAPEETSRQSFVSALHKKYDCDDDDDDEPLSIVIHIPKSAPGKTENGDLIVPTHLALNYSQVVEAGPMQDIAGVIVNVTELDLSMNLLSQWAEVFRIISYIPRICFLNLSNNPLHESIEFSWTGEPFAAVTELVLNAVRISWNTMWNLFALMPQIQELHLSLNEISSVERITDQTFPNVSSLYMNGNNISSWEEVEKLGCIFPGLTNLVLMDNPLTELTTEIPNANFCALKSLNLGNTNLSSWTELEKLKGFPCLTDVKVHGIPFLENYEEKLRRFLIVGYLPHVERLNGSPVSATEREDAERAFIRHHMNMDAPPSRYGELVAVYGQLDPLVDVDLSAKDTVTVMVYYQNKSHLRNFSIHATALDVKKILARELVTRPHQAFHVYHHDVGSSFGHSIMNFQQRTLLNYRVKDGDEFYVELKQ